MYRIERESVRAGLRGSTVRIEQRLDGTVVARYHSHCLPLVACVRPQRVPEPPKPTPIEAAQTRIRRRRPKPQPHQILTVNPAWRTAASPPPAPR